MKKFALALLASAPLMLTAFANDVSAATGEELMRAKACVACHSVDRKMVGPAYQDVAAKRGAEADGLTTLINNIKNGSAGVYGPIPMPPNAVTDEEAKILAEWIMSLK